MERYRIKQPSFEKQVEEERAFEKQAFAGLYEGLADILGWERGVMSRETYMMILACHPDNSASDEKRTLAFIAFRDLAKELIKKPQPSYEERKRLREEREREEKERKRAEDKRKREVEKEYEARARDEWIKKAPGRTAKDYRVMKNAEKERRIRERYELRRKDRKRQEAADRWQMAARMPRTAKRWAAYQVGRTTSRKN